MSERNKKFNKELDLAEHRSKLNEVDTGKTSGLTVFAVIIIVGLILYMLNTVH